MKHYKHPSVMRNQFSTVPTVSVSRSIFRRDHGHKTTFNAGLLVPIFCEEILPGDSMKVNASLLARLATPIYPVMDNVYLDTFFFFVPNRLVWDNWEKFNGAQDNPGDSIDFLVPQVTCPSGGYTALSIYDYLAIPVGIDNIDVNALPLRAYNLVWNTWFRDENLQNSVTVDKDDGPDADTQYTLLRRGKRHDYFTSSLPSPQKGDAVTIPLGTTAPIIGDGNAIKVVGGSSGNSSALEKSSVDAGIRLETTTGWAGFENLFIDDNASGLVADLSTATAATINQLRLAFQTQRLLERDARSGTRYVEMLKAQFGVTSPDFRLQRPEYLGGGSQPLDFSPVANTTNTDSGDLSAFAVSAGAHHGFAKSFVEHGYVIGVVSARADLTYQTGLHRMWSRRTRYDFAYPVLAHIGEQSVLNKEIYAQGTAADENVFGYQERYAEYRYSISKVTGLFRSDHPQSLDAWHLSQDFASLPPLAASFIEDNPPIDRVIRVSTEPHFIMDTYFNVRHARPLPVRGIPGMIDHF